MSGTFINIIIQLIAGAIGGNAAGNALKDYDLGMLGNSISGAVGGVAGGTVLQSLIPMLAGGAGGVDIGAVLGQAVGGGVAGAILTEAGLSFLGLGIQPPNAALGKLISDGQSEGFNLWWLVTFPGLVIVRAAVAASRRSAPMRAAAPAAPPAEGAPSLFARRNA